MKSLPTVEEEVSAAPTDGAGVEVEASTVSPVRMDPAKRVSRQAKPVGLANLASKIKTGAQGMQTTPPPLAVGLIGDMAQAPTTAAIGLHALGKTGSFPDHPQIDGLAGSKMD